MRLRHVDVEKVLLWALAMFVVLVAAGTVNGDDAVLSISYGSGPVAGCTSYDPACKHENKYLAWANALMIDAQYRWSEVDRFSQWCGICLKPLGCTRRVLCHGTPEAQCLAAQSPEVMPCPASTLLPCTTVITFGGIDVTSDAVTP